MNARDIIILLLVFIIFTLLFKKLYDWFTDDVVRVKAFDGNYYTVRKETPTSFKDKFTSIFKRKNNSEPTKTEKETADHLAHIKKRCDTLISHLNDEIPNYSSHGKGILRLRQRWHDLNTKGGGIRQTGNSEKSAAYLVNKNSELRICLTEKPEGGEKEDLNLSMFVILHELAHMMSEKYGHGQEFMDNMRFLVEVAAKKGLYTPHLFSTQPEDYCGVKITSGPCGQGECKTPP